MERLWLAVAVATLWLLEVGGEDEVAEPGRGGAPKPKKEVGKDMPALPDLKRGEPEEAPGTEPRPGTSAERTWSVFGRGWNLVRNALAVGVVLLGSWHPEAWPDHPWAGLPPTPTAGPAEAGASREGSDRRPVTTMENAAHRLDSS